MRRPAEVAAVILVLTSLAACGPFSPGNADPDASNCAVTAITVAPESVAVGGTVTLTGAPSGCDPGRDYELTLSDDQYNHPVPITATADSDGGFTTEVTVPDDFPVGGARIVLVAPYPPCNDTGGSVGAVAPVASCAGVDAYFQVEAAQ